MKTKTELEADKLILVTKARDIAAKADAERGGELTGEEMTEITSLVEQAKAIHTQILSIDAGKALRDELNVLGEDLGSIASNPTGTVAGGATLGEKFTNAPEFKSWLGSIAGKDGVVPEMVKGFRSPVLSFGMKDLVTGASVTSAGALVEPQWLGLLDGLAQFQRPLTIRSLITTGQTGTDTVEYARVTGFTNNAAPVAEAVTDLAVGANAGGSIGTVDSVEAGVKPKSGLALQKVSTSVKTIAHWIPATKRALADAGQIRTLIDSFLRYGLDEELEDQIMNGGGTGEDFEGILEVSGTQAQPWDTDLLTTLRKGKTLVRTQGRAVPTAYVLNPEDMERIDLLRDGSGGTPNSGNFFFGGPGSNSSNTLWGIPRVESEAIPAGTAVVADWRQAILWDREQAGIVASDSHADFFTRNLVAILAEMRAAFGVIRPKAFVVIELDGGS